MKTAEHNGLRIVFDPLEHIYTLNGQPLTSVTTLIHDLFPPFDKIDVSEKYAKKHGETPEHWQEVWEEKGRVAREKGTAIHEFIENKLLGKDIEISYKTYNKILDALIIEITKKYEVVALEKLVFSPKYRIAGTIDAILKDKETGEYVIADWKTNEKIKTKNFFQKGLGDFSHLDDANYNHYLLQLNLYQIILEEESYFPYFDYKKEIYHIQEDKVTPYELETVNEELYKILEERL